MEWLSLILLEAALCVTWCFSAHVPDMETKNVPVMFVSKNREKRSGFIFQCNGAANVLMPDAGIVEQGFTNDNLFRKQSEMEDENEIFGMKDLQQELKDVSSLLKKVLRKVDSDVDHKMDEMENKMKKMEKDKDHFKKICRDPCHAPFEFVAERCLYIPRSASNMTWQDGSNKCQEQGSRLLIFKDANDFLEIVTKLRDIFGNEKDVRRWIGGSDLEKEGQWMWIDGTPMPLGAPYWGTRNDYLLEPSGGTDQNCAGVFSGNHFYLHDYPCRLGNSEAAPLCEYYP